MRAQKCERARKCESEGELIRAQRSTSWFEWREGGAHTQGPFSIRCCSNLQQKATGKANQRVKGEVDSRLLSSDWQPVLVICRLSLCHLSFCQVSGCSHLVVEQCLAVAGAGGVLWQCVTVCDKRVGKKRRKQWVGQLLVQLHVGVLLQN